MLITADTMHFEISPELFITSCIVLGAIMGSFLGMLVHRLPIMLNNLYLEESIAYLELNPADFDQSEPINLVTPRSFCPHCKQSIENKYNIPIIGFLLSKGKCSHCQKPISYTYPLIEILTSIGVLVCGLYFGPSIEFIAASCLTMLLIAISFIDSEHKIIPDQLSILGIWIGLNANIMSLFSNIEDAVLGATLGYLILWCTAKGYELITGRFAMGHGDFKLLAAGGAWLGWQQLPFAILLSSLMAAIVGIAMIRLQQANWHSRLPFGPFIAIAIWVTLIWGDSLILHYYHLLSW